MYRGRRDDHRASAHDELDLARVAVIRVWYLNSTFQPRNNRTGLIGKLRRTKVDVGALTGNVGNSSANYNLLEKSQKYGTMYASQPRHLTAR